MIIKIERAFYACLCWSEPVISRFRTHTVAHKTIRSHTLHTEHSVRPALNNLGVTILLGGSNSASELGAIRERSQ